MSDQLSTNTADAVGLLAAKTATYGGGASAFVFGLSANEIAAVVGALVAVAGLCVQVFFNRRKDRRDAEYHAERMEFRAKFMEPLAKEPEPGE